jgi:protein phosphatase
MSSAFPVRWNWAAEYRGRAVVVYGHTPVPEAEWLNRTINVDTGCVFGGRLTDCGIPRRTRIAALEVMGRFAVNPKWLVYLPPAVSPSATTSQPDLLEHPAEAFSYYRQEGVPQVVCEEKHTGSRAVLVVCRDEDAGFVRGVAAARP